MSLMAQVFGPHPPLRGFAAVVVAVLLNEFAIGRVAGAVIAIQVLYLALHFGVLPALSLQVVRRSALVFREQTDLRDRAEAALVGVGLISYLVAVVVTGKPWIPGGLANWPPRPIVWIIVVVLGLGTLGLTYLANTPRWPDSDSQTLFGPHGRGGGGAAF